MNWLTLGKSALGLVTSIGVGNIIGNIVKATTPAGLNTFNKISVGLATFVVTGVVADKAVEYLNKEIDSAVDSVKKKEQPKG